MALCLSNDTALAVQFRITQSSSLRGAFLVPPRSSLTLKGQSVYLVRARLARREYEYESVHEFEADAYALLAIQRSGPTPPPFELERDIPITADAICCENTTRHRLVFHVERRSPSLRGVVALDPFERHAFGIADDYELTAIIDGYRTGPLWLDRLEGAVRARCPKGAPELHHEA